MNFAQASQKFGSVTFNGVEYAMTKEAEISNFGTDGEVRYYARAINQTGESFLVAWDTTVEWDASNAIAQLELQGKSVDMAEIVEKYGVDHDFTPYDLSDESYACDWDAPVSVIAQ